MAEKQPSGRYGGQQHTGGTGGRWDGTTGEQGGPSGGMSRGDSGGACAIGDGDTGSRITGTIVELDHNTPASVGTVVVLVNNAKKELLEHQNRSIGLVLDKLNQMSGTSLNPNSTTLRAGTTTGKSGDDKGGTAGKRSKAPAPKNIDTAEYQYEMGLVRDQDKMEFFAQWACAMAINSVFREYPALQAWIPERTSARLAAHSGILQRVSCLSIMFFSVKDSNWDRYHTRIGKAWTFLLAQVISSSIAKVRRDIFGSHSGSPCPPWLKSFGSVVATAKYVGETLTYFNTTKKMAKQLREMAQEAEGGSDEESMRPAKRLREVRMDKHKLERDYVINEMYSTVRRLLSYARTEARKHVLSGFMFLVDEVKKSASLTAAKSKGYEVEFCPASSDFECIVPAEIVQNSIWDVKEAATHAKFPDATDDELHAMNSELLKKLAKDFPSLSLTLHNKRQIIVPESGCDTSEIPKYWDEKEDVSLIEIALKILTSMSLAAKDSKLLLRSSVLTLRAVLILAFGLKGLVKQCLGFDPVYLEKVALGPMSARSLQKEEETDIEIVTTAIRAGSTKVLSKNKKRKRDWTKISKSPRGPKTCIVESIRNEKFLIQYDEYLRKLSMRNALRVADDATSRSEGGRSPIYDGQNEQDDIDEAPIDLDESYLA